MPAAVRGLVLQLYSDSVGQIVAAERALGDLGPAAVAAAPYLASMLPGHFSVAEANGAAGALVRIGKGAFAAVAVAAYSPSGETRWRATLALAAIDPVRAPPVILEIFAAGRGRDQELVALRKCGQAGLDCVLEALRSPDAGKRRAAAGALVAFSTVGLRCRGLDGHSGTGDAPAPVENTQMVVDLLLRAVGAAEAEVRLAALQSLARVASAADRKLPLAAGLRAALKDADAGIRREAVGVVLLADDDALTRAEALKPLTADPDPDTRGAAVTALGALAGAPSRCVPLLTGLLKDPSPAIREKAALALSQLRVGEAEGPLLETLTDEYRPLRLAAAKALATVSGKAGVQALIELARSEPDPAVRLEAVLSLAALYEGYCGKVPKPQSPKAKAATFKPEDAGLAEAIAGVLTQCLSDPFAELHYPAIVALTRTPQGANKDLIPLLELALRSESGPARTYVVRRFLPASGIRDDRLLNAIHERLMNPRAEMGEREYALSLLARWGDPRSLPVFAEIVRRGGAKTGAAIGGLIAAGGEHLEAVLKSLGHPRSAAEVAKALARCMDNPRVSAFVRSALTSPSEDLRRGAQLVVGNVPETAGAFVPPAEHLRSSVRGGSQAWRERLAALPKADATQAATALLKDADAAVRAAAAAMLGMLKAPSAVPALIQALADPSVSVRAQAGEALGALGDRQATAAVLRALQDPEAGVREAAAVALGQLADPLALDSLLKVLDSPDWQLRRAAAQGLGGFPDARAGQALQRLGRCDPHWCVRRTAVSALGRRGDKSVAPALIWALEDEHWSVRSSAHESLVAVTSQKFGDSPEAWRAWWARQPGAQARPGKRD